ncbi:unnamed protein product [Orchesella dallaii]|uniref:F-box domain-containing protein n=1 Tax=Orchesella dallaii TaxID=48710 RepID=A0ABP1Q4Z8_9HEXA
MEEGKESITKRKLNSISNLQTKGNQAKMQMPAATNPENESDPASARLRHPLLDVDLTLVNVLSYLEIDELKAANLVCKTWSSQVTKLLVKKGTFLFTTRSARRFLYKPSLDAFESLRSKIYGGTIRLKLHLRQRDDDPSSSIQSRPVANTITMDEAENLISRLVGKGTVITDLDLQFCTCTADVRNIWLKIVCATAKHLERLNINFECGDTHCASEVVCLGTETFFEQHKTQFSNLKEISCQVGRISSKFTMLVFIRHLILNSPVIEGLHCQLPSRRHEMFGIMESGRPDIFQNLKNLSSISLNQEEMEMMSKNGVTKLRSLSFTLYSGFRVPTIYPFLSSLGETLESLDIDFVTLPRVPEPFPCGIDLVHIKHLTLKKFYGSIHFVSYMSNIETLCLEDANLSVALHDEASKFQYKSGLKSLKIFGGRGSTGRFLFPAVYHEIVRFFPHLTKLRMEYFTDSTIKIIVEGLPNLVELDIPNGIYSDVILTGGDHKKENCHFGETEERPDILEKAACLSDLKRLRKLVLQSPKITDVGVRYGLMYCRELRSLSVDTPMISDASLELLSSSPHLRHLEFINCYQLTQKAIANAREKWGRGRELIIVHK